jgi:hypothetical protein
MTHSFVLDSEINDKNISPLSVFAVRKRLSVRTDVGLRRDVTEYWAICDATERDSHTSNRHNK